MRFYRLLLHLYPSAFRREYGATLRATFAESSREHTGALAPIAIVLAALADVVPNAIAAHWDLLRQDLTVFARAMRRTPGFAVTAVLIVALGVGANTAAFSLADFVLVRPLPFPRPDRLIKLWERTPGYSQLEASPANYRDWKAQLKSVDGMGAFFVLDMNLVGLAEPRRLVIGTVTPELMRVLGVNAFLGRPITPADTSDTRLVVLSYALWQTEFGGNAEIVGTSIRLDDSPFTIIGVMPPSFRYPARDVEAWIPRVLHEDDYADRSDNYLAVVARMKPGVSIAQVNAELGVIADRLAQQYPKDLKDTRTNVLGFRDELTQRSRLLVLALCGAALCILLLACANLASLLIARAAARGRELAVRAALGAGRERLERQLLTESIALAGLGGVLGIAVAIVGAPLLARFVPTALPVADRPSVDARALIVATLLVLLTGVAFGIGPAIVATRTRALDALRDSARAGGGRTQRVRALLVTVEVAASLVLLISSGLLIRAVLRIQAIDPGFSAAHVLVVRTPLPMAKYQRTRDREQFYDRVLPAVRALPGVQSAAYVSGVPMDMRGGIWPVGIGTEATQRASSNTASLRFVTPGYFATLGIPIREGRDVATTDTRQSPSVAVVSRSLVERYWPNADPIGKRFTFAFSERTIVGVVGDVRVRGLERESEPQAYVPAGQVDDSSLAGYWPRAIVVRSSVPAAALVPSIRRIVQSADPEQPISDAQPMEQLIAGETASRVTQLQLLGVLSAVALLIAGIGIHGLLMFTVAQRSQELGIRRALGERTGRILGRILGEGMGLALAGVAIGVVVAYFAGRAMSALLAGIEPGDPPTFAAASLLCFSVAALGCLRPALRAASVDPLAALRGD